MEAIPDTLALAVLDTNVVLDWLVFRNPECVLLGAAIVAGRLRWAATGAMRDELAHVLARGHLDAWHADPAAVWASWERHCTQVAAPAPAAPSGRLRCTDPDDQKFIDLALAVRADWLISRDRAVLRLARRLGTHGVQAVPPGRWLAPGTGSAA